MWRLRCVSCSKGVGVLKASTETHLQRLRPEEPVSHAPAPDAAGSPPASPGASGPAASADAFILVDGVEMYRVGGIDRMQPFLICLVSDSDHWLYVSSRGGLTAGRVEPEQALFPYVTDDLLHLCHPSTGPYSLLRIAGRRGPALWEPFRDPGDDGEVTRNLYKSVAGNLLLFEEIHAGLGLAFRYRWASSDRFGFVRTSTVENLGSTPVRLDLVDGLLNLMPAGVPLGLQQKASCLVNAYTRAEVDPGTRLGLVSLQAQIVDHAKPAESLRATAVWCAGLAAFEVVLSTDQLPAFRRGATLRTERELKGRRAAYLVSTALELQPGESRSWDLLADVGRSHLQIEELRAGLLSRRDLREEIEVDIRRGTGNLLRNIASADGLQHTADRTTTAHHFANVLFNNMRGGVFVQNHQLPWSDFRSFVGTRNRATASRFAGELQARAGDTSVGELLAWARDTGDPDLFRLALEYLPLTFSRRHGDPSRPWNAFAIRLKNPDGTRALDYQGNWRDIFQNWEALCRSFPEYLESVIAKFVNATTADGFNAYRLSRDGIDWEVPEPADPWSNIGYWGDHQIIYLLKLLEASAGTHPGRLESLLGARIFCFADVPYRLKTYAEIVRDPRHTILFDGMLAEDIAGRVARLGTDGKLLRSADGGIVRATLAEKLLVPVLAKLANLVLDGGIWMNTQRPEWNDANNALVGNGVSVVTLCYLRRHLAFCAELFERAPEREVELSVEVGAWLGETRRLLLEQRSQLREPRVADAERRRLLDALGRAFETYRGQVNTAGLTPGARLDLRDAAGFCRLALEYVDHSIRANLRPDGLYHSYNLLELHEGPPEARLDHLYEMLEGQVAALSAGLLGPTESLAVLDALFASRLFREDQQSFMLYPDRDLPGFLHKNVVPAADVEANPLLSALLAAGDDSVVVRDAFGRVRFCSDFSTTDDLAAALGRLREQERFAALETAHAGRTLSSFERVFELKSFTGRSGTMYGYEGLGCIYWHMVGKLLLAVQETHDRALREAADAATVQRLADAYHRVRSGLGFKKSARVWGGFPIDPYSHTPRHAGAQQPGMTGQVKEELLARFGELGVQVEDGCLSFQPTLLQRGEFLAAPSAWTVLDLEGRPEVRALARGELGFTFCQTPVVYRLATEPGLTVRLVGGETRVTRGCRLDPNTSREVLSRSGAVAAIEVEVPEAGLQGD